MCTLCSSLPSFALANMLLEPQQWVRSHRKFKEWLLEFNGGWTEHDELRKETGKGKPVWLEDKQGSVASGELRGESGSKDCLR